MKLDPRRVLRARELLGYGTAKAAEEAGVSETAYLRAEHGEEIRPGTARKVAAGLGLSVADLYPALGGETAPKASAWPSPEQAERLREIRERYLPFAEILDFYSADYEGLIRDGKASRGTFGRYALTLATVREGVGRAYVGELEAIADVLGLARHARERVLSGGSMEGVEANIDARLQEHSVMLPALRRYFALGHALAEAADDKKEADEQVRRAERALPGVAA